MFNPFEKFKNTGLQGFGFSRGLIDLSSIYMSMGNQHGIPPSGITVNEISVETVPSSPIALVDEDDTSTSLTVTWDLDFDDTTSDGPVKGDDTGFLFDGQQKRGFYKSSTATRVITIGGLDASHIYSFEISGGTFTTDRTTKYTMNGNLTDLVVSDNVDNGATETNITGVTSFDITIEGGTGGVLYVMGINIRRST